MDSSTVLVVTFLVLLLSSSISAQAQSAVDSEESAMYNIFESECQRDSSAEMNVTGLEFELNGSKVSTLECEKLGQYEFDEYSNSEAGSNSYSYLESSNYFFSASAGVFLILTVSAGFGRYSAGRTFDYLKQSVSMFLPLFLFGFYAIVIGRTGAEMLLYGFLGFLALSGIIGAYHLNSAQSRKQKIFPVLIFILTVATGVLAFLISKVTMVSSTGL